VLRHVGRQAFPGSPGPDALRSLADAPSSAIAAAVYLGLLPSALGFVVWGYAVARLSLAVSTAALYLVPPVALVVAFVWLGEIPRLVELVGGLITIVGVLVINRRQCQSHPLPEAEAVPEAEAESALTTRV
jgi:drug/metabolite transporter (DMT)-like permease